VFGFASTLKPPSVAVKAPPAPAAESCRMASAQRGGGGKVESWTVGWPSCKNGGEHEQARRERSQHDKAEGVGFGVGRGRGGGCLGAHELAHDWGALRLDNCILLQLLLLHAIILVFLVHVQLVFERGLYALDLILKGN